MTPPLAEKLMRAKDKTCSEANGTWAGSRETNLHSGLGRTFFLTSLFIEPEIAIGHEPRIEPWLTHSTTTRLLLSQLHGATCSRETYESRKTKPAAKPMERGLDFEKPISIPV